MLRVTTRAPRSARAQAQLTLTYEARQRRRLRARLDDGREVALLLERGPILRDGDRLRAEDGLIVGVRSAPESISRAQSGDPTLLARACYHLGNRHVPLAIEPGGLCYPQDHVLDALAERLGLRVVHAVEPFEPEPGAYADADRAHGPAHTHAHGAPHAQSRAHEHGHSRDHAHAHDHARSHGHSRSHSHASARAETEAEPADTAARADRRRAREDDPGGSEGA